MPPLRSTEILHANVLRRSLTVMLVARREWARIDPNGDWLAQWQMMVPRLAAVVLAAQVGAATDGSASVATALLEAKHPEPKLANINPAAFGGWVAPSWTGENGILLTDYLLTPVATARNAFGAPQEMLAAGGKVLDALSQYAVTEAAAHAHDAQIVATRNTYSVFVEPGSMCQRCAVLVGKRYKPGTHVKRHPSCDGVMEARSDADPFEAPSLDPARIKDLTIGQREAIGQGADMNQVLNAKRQGAISGIYTTEGTTRRGFGYHAIKTRHSAFNKAADRKLPGKRYASTTVGRLSPETIYRVAKDQTDMVRLLRIYGYIL